MRFSRAAESDVPIVRQIAEPAFAAGRARDREKFVYGLLSLPPRFRACRSSLVEGEAASGLFCPCRLGLAVINRGIVALEEE